MIHPLRCRRSVLLICIVSALVVLQRLVDSVHHRHIQHVHEKVLRFTKLEAELPITCNLTQFHEVLDLDSNPPVVPRNLVGKCTGILYNRVPKCASRFLKDLFEAVITKNNHSMIFIDSSYDANEKNYVYEMKRANGRFVLVSHFFYVDFNSLYDEGPLIYINLVREPIEWFKSLYYFHQNGFVSEPFTHPLGTLFNRSIAECVRRDDCLNRIHVKFGPLRFFCGKTESCMHVNDEILQRAKRTIGQEYLMVGVYEDLLAVNQVLEYLLPQVFRNLTNTFLPMASREEKTKSQATIGKEALDNQTQAILRSKFKYDYDLYYFIKQRFYQLLDAIRSIRNK